MSVFLSADCSREEPEGRGGREVSLSLGWLQGLLCPLHLLLLAVQPRHLTCRQEALHLYGGRLQAEVRLPAGSIPPCQLSLQESFLSSSKLTAAEDRPGLPNKILYQKEQEEAEGNSLPPIQ